nr:hypothetical protein [Tanacetum cinerariifolium]
WLSRCRGGCGVEEGLMMAMAGDDRGDDGVRVAAIGVDEGGGWRRLWWGYGGGGGA